MSDENVIQIHTELPKSTLGDHGHQLPIGIIEGTPPALAKAFAFKPYRTKEEREFGKLRRKKGGAGNHAGRIVAELLASMLTEWGGDTEFANKSHKIRSSAVLNAYMTDVLYAYLVLRTEALGELIELSVECPRCQHDWKWTADLRSLDFSVVRTVEDLSDLQFVLRDPITFGSHKYDTLTLRPPTWGAVANVTGRTNEGEIKSRLILSAVQQVTSSADAEAPPIALGNNLLDQITKRELEELNGELNDTFPSIDLSMEIECPRCAGSFMNMINWQFDFFFGTSSLPRRKPN